MKFSLSAMLMVVPLAGLLTWLTWHSAGPSGSALMLAQRDVARVSLGEAALRADVLEARVGLLRNYDTLVSDMQAFNDAVIELGQQAMILNQDRGLLSALKAKTVEDEAALEQFKSDNALLQNSLAYFDVLDTRLVEANADPAMTGALAGLSNTMLELSHHPTADLRVLVQTRLAAINARAAEPPGKLPPQDVALLLTHGRLLARLLPQVDGDLHTLFNVSTYELRQAIRRSQDARRRASEIRASRYRTALFLTAVTLLAVLVRVGLQFRATLRLLRARADIEAVIADVSNRLLAAQMSDYDDVIKNALFRLGSAFQADRAYLVETAPPRAYQIWCAPYIDAPSLFPDPIVDTALEAIQRPDDTLEIAPLKHAAGTKLTEMLARMGVAGWCGAALRVGGKRTALLGFDYIHPAHGKAHIGTGLLRMAGEVMQSALQRRHAAIERQSFETRLARARRLETLGVFASGIAHNFNNVLGVMIGHAEMAADAATPQSEAGRHVAQVLRATQRAQDLVGRILDFGTRRTAPHVPLSVDNMVGETIGMVKVMLPANIELMVEPRAPGRMVRGDAVQLEQVLLNLVRNASQAIASSGTITIRADQVVLQSPKALFYDTVPPGNYIRISVADTGSGMDATTLANIFRPFFTTRPAGTGLGLATLREIVHDHHGAIDVRSAQSQGSTFTIWLPEATETGPATALPELTGKTILMLASSQSLMHKDEEMLAALGFEPVGFHDVPAALQAARQNPSGYDAMLIDPSQFGDTALSALRKFRDALPTVAAILVTDHPGDYTAAALAELGITAHLKRPLTSAILAAALADCLRL